MPATVLYGGRREGGTRLPDSEAWRRKDLSISSCLPHGSHPRNLGKQRQGGEGGLCQLQWLSAPPAAKQLTCASSESAAKVPAKKYQTGGAWGGAFLTPLKIYWWAMPIWEASTLKMDFHTQTNYPPIFHRPDALKTRLSL